MLFFFFFFPFLFRVSDSVFRCFRVPYFQGFRLRVSGSVFPFTSFRFRVSDSVCPCSVFYEHVIGNTYPETPIPCLRLSVSDSVFAVKC